MSNTRNKNNIYRVNRKEANYSVILNTPIVDRRIAWETSGVLAYLLSKPDGWEIRNQDLLNQRDSGEHVIRRITKQMKECGYLLRIRERRKDGKFRWITDLYETPTDNPGVIATLGLVLFLAKILNNHICSKRAVCSRPPTGSESIQATSGHSTGERPYHIVSTELVSTEKNSSSSSENYTEKGNNQQPNKTNSEQPSKGKMINKKKVITFLMAKGWILVGEENKIGEGLLQITDNRLEIRPTEENPFYQQKEIILGGGMVSMETLKKATGYKSNILAAIESLPDYCPVRHTAKACKVCGGTSDIEFAIQQYISNRASVFYEWMVENDESKLANSYVDEFISLIDGFNSSIVPLLFYDKNRLKQEKLLMEVVLKIQQGLMSRGITIEDTESFFTVHRDFFYTYLDCLEYSHYGYEEKHLTKEELVGIAHYLSSYYHGGGELMKSDNDGFSDTSGFLDLVLFIQRLSGYEFSSNSYIEETVSKKLLQIMENLLSENMDNLPHKYRDSLMKILGLGEYASKTDDTEPSLSQKMPKNDGYLKYGSETAHPAKSVDFAPVLSVLERIREMTQFGNPSSYWNELNYLLGCFDMSKLPEQFSKSWSLYLENVLDREFLATEDLNHIVSTLETTMGFGLDIGFNGDLFWHVGINAMEFIVDVLKNGGDDFIRSVLTECFRYDKINIQKGDVCGLIVALENYLEANKNLLIEPGVGLMNREELEAKARYLYLAFKVGEGKSPLCLDDISDIELTRLVHLFQRVSRVDIPADLIGGNDERMKVFELLMKNLLASDNKQLSNYRYTLKKMLGLLTEETALVRASEGLDGRFDTLGFIDSDAYPDLSMSVYQAIQLMLSLGLRPLRIGENAPLETEEGALLEFVNIGNGKNARIVSLLYDPQLDRSLGRTQVALLISLIDFAIDIDTNKVIEIVASNTLSDECPHPIINNHKCSVCLEHVGSTIREVVTLYQILNLFLVFGWNIYDADGECVRLCLGGKNILLNRGTFDELVATSSELLKFTPEIVCNLASKLEDSCPHDDGIEVSKDGVKYNKCGICEKMESSLYNLETVGDLHDYQGDMVRGCAYVDRDAPLIDKVDIKEYQEVPSIATVPKEIVPKAKKDRDNDTAFFINDTSIDMPPVLFDTSLPLDAQPEVKKFFKKAGIRGILGVDSGDSEIVNKSNQTHGKVDIEEYQVKDASKEDIYTQVCHLLAKQLNLDCSFSGAITKLEELVDRVASVCSKNGKDTVIGIFEYIVDEISSKGTKEAANLNYAKGIILNIEKKGSLDAHRRKKVKVSPPIEKQFDWLSLKFFDEDEDRNNQLRALSSSIRGKKRQASNARLKRNWLVVYAENHSDEEFWNWALEVAADVGSFEELMNKLRDKDGYSEWMGDVPFDNGTLDEESEEFDDTSIPALTKTDDDDDDDDDSWIC